MRNKVQIFSKIILFVFVLVTFLLYRTQWLAGVPRMVLINPDWRWIMMPAVTLQLIIIPCVIFERIFGDGQQKAPRAEIIWTAVSVILYLVIGSSTLNFHIYEVPHIHSKSTLMQSTLVKDHAFAAGSFSIITALLMTIDLIVNTVWLWTTSNMFVRNASPLDTVTKVPVTEEIEVNDYSALEENIKKMAGIVGRKQRR